MKLYASIDGPNFYLDARPRLFALIFWSSEWLSRGSSVRNISHGVSRHMRSIGFPEGSGTGIFFALGVPVDVPDKSVLFSFYFEANYGLPADWKSTHFADNGFFWKRSLHRRLAYELIESKLESAGFPGRICLLKTICQVAKRPLVGNGLLGDVLQILFAPSSSRDESLPNEITDAERVDDCDRAYVRCPKSLLDHISYFAANETDL